MARPPAMHRFDLAYLGSIAVSGVGMVWDYDAMVAYAEADPLLAGIGAEILGIAAFVVLLIAIVPWYLAGYRRLRFARWMLVILLGVGLVSLPDLLAPGVSVLGAASLASLALHALALWFLFRPESNAWFSGKVDRAVFD